RLHAGQREVEVGAPPLRFLLAAVLGRGLHARQLLLEREDDHAEVLLLVEQRILLLGVERPRHRLGQLRFGTLLQRLGRREEGGTDGVLVRKRVGVLLVPVAQLGHRLVAVHLVLIEQRARKSRYVVGAKQLVLSRTRLTHRRQDTNFLENAGE